MLATAVADFVVVVIIMLMVMVLSKNCPIINEDFVFIRRASFFLSRHTTYHKHNLQNYLISICLKNILSSNRLDSLLIKMVLFDDQSVNE